MKGLLLKEFYVWAKSRSWILILSLLLGLFYEFASGETFVLSLASISLARAFTDDETSKWDNYSHALPYTAAQIVSSRYLITLAEITIYTIYITVLEINYLKSTDGIGFAIIEHFPYLSDNWVILSNMTLFFTVWLLGLAISMPLNYKLRGVARGIICLIPYILSAVFCALILIYIALDPYSINDTIPKIFYNEKWVFAACAAAAILAISVSWLLCIIFADNSKKRTKKLTAPAAILAAALIAVSVFSLTSLHSKGYFEKEDYATKYEKYYGQFETDDNNISINSAFAEEEEVTDAQKECRDDMLNLMDSLCAKNNLGRNLQELKEEILNMGYYDTDYFSEEFHSVEDKDAYVSIQLYTAEDTDTVTVVDISAKVGQFWIESATTAELEAIGNQFTVGMSQSELHETFKSLGIVPKHISERYFDETQHVLYYSLTYTVGSYNGDSGTYYNINIDVTGGAVSDIRLYYD